MPRDTTKKLKNSVWKLKEIRNVEEDPLYYNSGLSIYSHNDAKTPRNPELLLEIARERRKTHTGVSEITEEIIWYAEERRHRWLLIFQNEEGEESDFTDYERWWWKRWKKIKQFFNFYSEKYKNKEISMLFLTLTKADNNSFNIRRFLWNYKRNLERHGIKVRGYFWVMEMGEKGMLHYHIALATDRIEVKELPEFLKPDKVGYWKAMTRVEFARKDLRYYLAKYFRKSGVRVFSSTGRWKRTWGCSRILK